MSKITNYNNLTTKEKKKLEKEEAIKIWKDLNLKEADFDFYCGGDSMGDTDIKFTNKDNKDCEVAYNELFTYIEDLVYDRVEFYEASDGHYMGEAGHVYVELNENGDDFECSKTSESEWNETFSSILEIPLTDDEREFVEKNVSSIVGGFDDSPMINYSRDLIITDKTEKIIEGLLQKVDEETQEFVPDFEGEFGDAELQEWYTYDSSDNNDIINEKGELSIRLDNQICVFREGD
tara:strand:- start:7845 stop:8549 length:705 start_codon:yes stop_codon:yes gene_type:complete